MDFTGNAVTVELFQKFHKLFEGKKEKKMKFKVVVYFDNMIDEEIEFTNEGKARMCLSQLKSKYLGSRLYRVELIEVQHG